MTINRVMFTYLGVCLCWLNIASADPILLRYEGDVVPDQASPAWLMDPCEPPCSEALEEGTYILRWTEPNNEMVAFHWITQPPQLAPDSLWFEWNYRSNHPIPPHSFTCDAWVIVQFREIVDLAYLNGDAVISFSGDEWVPGLELNQFHTYRFESPDGERLKFSVDGFVFRSSIGTSTDNGHASVQFAGDGGCLDDWIPNMENAWDFVRYGTISYGEQIVETGPAEGFIDARQHPSLDRFTIRYDSANYVYIDEITVEVLDNEPQGSQQIACTFLHGSQREPRNVATGGAERNPWLTTHQWDPPRSGRGIGTAISGNAISCSDCATPFAIDNRQSQIDNGPDDPNPERQRRAVCPALALGVPIVTATRRLDNGPADVVEIVLDQPIPYNATTRFTFDDGALSQAIEFTHAPGDIDGDGQARLSDFAAFQNCFGISPHSDICPVLDLNPDSAIDLSDFTILVSHLSAR